MSDIGTQTIEAFLTSLASKQPTPGGGAVAGLLAALSTSLGSMVLEYSRGKESLEEHTSLHDKSAGYLQAARDEALELSDADADAYRALHALWKLRKDDPKRKENLDQVVQEAIAVPIHTMELSERVLSTLHALIGKTNTMLASDLAIAAIIANAAAKSANLNVRINIPLLSDSTEQEAYSTRAQTILTACNKLADSIESACHV